MTAPTGVGRGGPRPGSGRPHGSTNHRTRKLIVEAERTGQLMPLDLLLSVVRDPEAPRRERLQAAAIAAPYLHPRLTVQRVVQGFIDPDQLSDAELLASIAQLEQLVAATPEVAAPDRPGNDQPGELGHQQAVPECGSPAPVPLLRRPGDDHPPAPAEARRLRYDPLDGKLKSVAQ